MLVYPKTHMLTLNPDRSIDIELGPDNIVRLRPPTVGEFRKIRDAYRSADDVYVDAHEKWTVQVAAETGDSDETGPEPTRFDVIWSDQNPYGHAFALVVSTLSQSSCDADQLPVWCLDTSVYALLWQHWTHVPVTRVNDQAAASPSTEGARPLPPAVQAALDAATSDEV